MRTAKSVALTRQILLDLILTVVCRCMRQFSCKSEVQSLTATLAQIAKPVRFEDVSYAFLCMMDPVQLDGLSFGVIGLNPEGIVEVYNKTEIALSGLNRDDVIGAHFFFSIAQCMNNFMVAQRLEDEVEVDAIVAYVLTFRMRPTPVRLRLLKRAGHLRRFVLIQR